MAMYLGKQKVSPSLNTIITKTITLDTSGNTISQSQQTTSNYIMEDPDNLAADLPIVTEWTRPSGWPNLDALPALTEGVYLTYDNTSKVDWKWAAFRCVMNTGSYTIAQGHVSENTWTLDATWTVASNVVQEINYGSSSYSYVVFKITPASTNHIRQFYFNSIAKATLNTYALRPLQDQYCLERVGKLPYLTSTAGSGDTYRYCTEWMQRDKVEFGDTLTSLNCAWYRGRKLKKVEFGNWTGENCNISNLEFLFGYCHDIEQLNLNLWDTRNWHPTNIQNMFVSCYSLKYLNVNWNTANWGNTSTRAISTLYIFLNCRSLENLDLSSWDVSQWKPNSLNQVWTNCYRLKSLNVKNWNTTNWNITSLNQTWNQCQSLVNIDLSGWVTTNWAITTLASTFAGNYKRRSFNDIKNWNTLNWAVTTMAAMFDSCYSVQEIDLSHWNVSNWPCTNLENLCNQCRSMRTFNADTWDMTLTDKWKVTSIYQMFLNCYTLENLYIWNWHPINWVLVKAGSAFYSCRELIEIDLTKWKNLNGNTLTWTLDNGSNNISYFATYCYNLRKLNISNLNLSNIAVGNYGSNKGSTTVAMEDYNLEELTLPATFAGHLNIRYDYTLTRNEIVKIFNALPTALSGASIIITEMRYKLTDADIAIATGKGYTVS